MAFRDAFPIFHTPPTSSDPDGNEVYLGQKTA
jgi:hypothetical protein